MANLDLIRSLSLKDITHCQRLSRRSRKDLIRDGQDLFKNGICSDSVRKQRALQRCLKSKELRKKKLNELRVSSKSSGTKKGWNSGKYEPEPKSRKAISFVATEPKTNDVKMNDINNQGQGIGGASESSPKIVKMLVDKIIELSAVTVQLKDVVCKLEKKITTLGLATSANGRIIRKVEMKLDAEHRAREIKTNNLANHKNEDIERDDGRKVNLRGINEFESKDNMDVDKAPKEHIPEEYHELDDPQTRINNEVKRLKVDPLEYLKSCFEEQIGIPCQTAQNLKIYSFDDVVIAKGFNKAVATWQGLFWELKQSDIAFWNLSRDQKQIPGIQSWSAKGVRVFKLTKPDKRVRPRQHRFAVNPTRSFKGPCNPLQVGKYYAHVYQTKVEVEHNSKRTLQSKRIASELQRMFGDRYNPRPGDLFVRRGGLKEQTNMNSNLMNHQPPRNWVPITQLQDIKPLASERITWNRLDPNSNQINNIRNINPNKATTSQSYKQVLLNQGDHGNQHLRYYSHFLPSNQASQVNHQSYKQVMTNQQGPVHQQSYPSLYLPAQQFNGVQNSQPHFQYRGAGQIH